jgi:hypothetical protein
MLRRQPKEKDRRRVPIPDELREALREALSLINESKRDPDIRVDYDDAIQVGRLVGGRVGSRKRPFEFNYYADGDRTRKTCWHLALHSREIEDIVDGCMTELTMYCCQTLGCGHRSSDPESLCDCDYFDDPYYGNLYFPNAAEALRRLGISGISELSDRQDVLDILGQPKHSGGGEKHPESGYILPWIKYNRTDCQLRFEFQESGRIRMVSILDPDWQPGMK